jgi:predicted HD phosphohydrolase
MTVGGSSVGRVGHEKIGEEYLRSLGFDRSVCDIVGSHVAAKRSCSPCPLEISSFLFLLPSPELRHYSRYLTAIDSSYYDSLSDASKKSLAFQGGPFKGEELEIFERHPLKDEMVRDNGMTCLRSLGLLSRHQER